MSTRANIIIRNGDKGCDHLLYHHHDGDYIGALLRQFILDIVTGDADDFADFLKDYTYPQLGYSVNEFEDATKVSTDIDYIYYVSIFTPGRKIVEGFKFPHPGVSAVGENHIGSNDIWGGDKIYDMFSTASDFTEERIRKYWRQSFYFCFGFSDEELGGGPSPKHMEG